MKKRLITIAAVASSLGAPLVAYAGILPSCATGAGNCHTCDFITFLVNILELSLSGISGIVILMFVVGGVFWIISSGNQEMVKKGQKIIIGSLIGLGFVMGSWMIVHVTIAAFMGADFDEVKLFGTNWYEYCEEGMTPQGAVTSCETPEDGASLEGTMCVVAGQCNDLAYCVCNATQACVSKCEQEAGKASKVGSCIEYEKDADGNVTTECTGGDWSWGDNLCAEDYGCCVTDSTGS